MEGLSFMSITRPEVFTQTKKDLMRDNMKTKLTPAIMIYAALRNIKDDNLAESLKCVERAI
jgi:hypothetical protein